MPFVVTIVAAGAACGADTETVPIGGRTEATSDVISNPAEPEPTPAPTHVETISNPAEPDPALQPEPAPTGTMVISNPAPPQDG